MNLMQRQYIPKFTTLSYLVRSTDYFQINKENKEKSRKIGINMSKMKIASLTEANNFSLRHVALLIAKQCYQIILNFVAEVCLWNFLL